MDRRVLAVLAALLVACTKKQPDAVKAVPAERVDAAAPLRMAPAATASATPKTDPSWQSDPPKSWTDRRVLEGLAADCDFLPPEAVSPEGESGTPADLFRCSLAYEQSCIPDPCAEPGDTCNTKCTETCRGCGTTCATSCKTCKAGCTDDACKRACASSCAECKQTCTRTMDRCTSGTCAQVSASCNADLARTFRANGCVAECGRLEKCRDACSNGPNAGPECWSKCTGKRDDRYTSCLTACTDESGCMLKCFKTSGCPSQLCETQTR